MTSVKFARPALSKKAMLAESGVNLSVMAARMIVLAGVRNRAKLGLTVKQKQNIGVDSLSKLTNIRHQTSGQNF